MADLYSVESWNEARKIASLAELTPNAFSTCVRFLRRDVEENQGTISKLSRYCLRTIVKSLGARVALYYAALTFKPEKIRANAEFNSDVVLSIFSADELAHLIALHFIFRRVQRGCNPEGFDPLQERILTCGEVGGHIGIAMPAIGLGPGFLYGAMRFIAIAMFLGIDSNGFSKYKRQLRTERKSFDLSAETAFWGCNHLQVAAMMLQLIGLGVDQANTFIAAFESSAISEQPISTEAYRGKITWTWIESLLSTGLPPDITHQGQFYPRAEALSALVNRAQGVRDRGSAYQWIAKRKEDATPEATPALFSAPKSGAYKADDLFAEELRSLSEDELKIDEE